jgi:hypothetical protein
MLLSLEPVWMPMTLRRIGGLAILLANSAEPAADFRSGPQIVAVDLFCDDRTGRNGLSDKRLLLRKRGPRHVSPRAFFVWCRTLPRSLAG